MKKIPLKTVTMTAPNGSEMELSYWTQLQSIMGAPMNTQGGLDVIEMRSSLRVMDALDLAGEEAEFFELEDVDYDFMAGKVKGSKYLFAHEKLIQFIDDVTKVE